MEEFNMAGGMCPICESFKDLSETCYFFNLPSNESHKELSKLLYFRDLVP